MEATTTAKETLCEAKDDLSGKAANKQLCIESTPSAEDTTPSAEDTTLLVEGATALIKDTAVLIFKKILTGSYKSIETGSFGRVVMVSEKKKNYAVKIFDPRKIPFFNYEVHMLNLLPPHYNIVNYIAYATGDIFSIIVFEKFQMDLYTGIERHYASVIKNIDSVVMQMLNALDHLHDNGIIHQDVKPDNFVMNFDKDGGIVLKLIDFGSAIHVSDTTSKFAISKLGTVGYIDPQVLITNHSKSTAQDIWAFGIILLSILSNSPPFGRGDIYPEWLNWIKKNSALVDCESPKIQLPSIFIKQSEPSLVNRQIVFYDFNRNGFSFNSSWDLLPLRSGILPNEEFVALLNKFMPLLNGCLSLLQRTRIDTKTAIDIINSL